MNESYIDVFCQKLQKNQEKLILVESCTGGLLSQLITERSGATAYFLGSLVTYSNTLKKRLCAVHKNTLDTNGAVSKKTALEMANGALKEHPEATISIAITGIAGPNGGSDIKPIGSVYIAISSKTYHDVKHYQFKGSRKRIQRLSAYSAVQLYLSQYKC